MNHNDHVDLLRDGVLYSGDPWADIGSGAGAFTLALADLLGPKGQIHSIDKDRWAVRRQKKMMTDRFPATAVTYHTADYTQPLPLPMLGGIVMANSLHFHQAAKRQKVLTLLRSYLRPGGRLILIEYNNDHGNRWVPYPLSFPTWQAEAVQAGFTVPTLLATKPSRFLGQIYSAMGISQ